MGKPDDTYRAFTCDVTNHMMRGAGVQLGYCVPLAISGFRGFAVRMSLHPAFNLSSTVLLLLMKWGNSLFLPIVMVMCIVTGYSNRSGQDTDVSFYRIPKVITGKGFKKEQLSKRRREGYIAAVSREGLTEKIISNDRVYFRHFVTGKPAALEDELHPDLLPTQHLGKLRHAHTSSAGSVKG